jgi:uroporphyrin-III C-methyltransferase/precorrin-2 dehydrogenase/sirohydrochlorin ferrochelatase
MPMPIAIAARKPVERHAARIEPLACLPVFFCLQERKAVIAGGAAGAAWKTELLAAAGARVTVFADEMSAEMDAIAIASSGRIRLHRRRAHPSDLEGAAIAVVDLDQAEAAAFSALARECGIPVNVVDKPALSDFTFGTIVNRSPVVIGISTDGAAPVLGQAIRRRIETLLPQTLAGWARAAKEIRTAVARRLPVGPLRRAFWERFVDRAFSGEVARGKAQDVAGLLDQVARSKLKEGCVTLVGAGPGDAELLTIKAVRALQRADVILYDALVSEEVLSLARREAKRMMVGKRGRGESCRQEDINATMLSLARQGRDVVRLKSGDPMIFGRAGEEIATLKQAGIRVEIVPGVTAALGAAARLGISLTNRDHAHSVRFVTGHSRDGELPADLDWRGLADPQTTLVVYMGGRTAPRIAGRLIAEGLPRSTPVVVIENATRRDERIQRTTLTRLVAQPIAATGPVILTIGQVFAQAGSIAAPADVAV